MSKLSESYQLPKRVKRVSDTNNKQRYNRTKTMIIGYASFTDGASAFNNALTYLAAGLSIFGAFQADTPTTNHRATIGNDGSVSCPVDIPLSCSNVTFVGDLCCFEYPGGAILLTQFWDYNPGIGPDDEFTLHGLWPDNCDGTFDQFCDKRLEIHDPETIVKSFDEDLYTEMKRVWKDYKGRDEYLWAHEYNKHGTCYTTLKPSCYEKDHKHQVYVYDFFKAAVDIHSKLPTYKFLTEAGIVPSDTATYSQEEILDALRNNFGGYEPYVKCDYNGAIQEVWYFHHLKGSVVNGEFQQINTLNSMRCPKSGIKFPPKKKPAPGNPIPVPNPGKPGNGGGDSSRGYMKLTGQPGCLIRNGKWYVSGSCATYTLIQNDDETSYTLKSSGGYCNVDESKTLSCGPSVQAGNFSFDEGTKTLGFGGEDTWTADVFPKGRTQAPVSLGSGKAFEFQLKFN